MLLVTLTVTVQVLGPTAEFTPVPPTVKTAAPATAVMVGAPPQLFTTFGIAAITTFAGNVSVKVSPLCAGDPAEFVMVKVSVELCATPTLIGTNALVSDGLETVRPLEVTLFVTRAVAPILAAVLL